MGNNVGTAIKNFFINVGKAIAKGLTKAVLGRVATRITGTPVLGNSLADAINSLYAVGAEDLGKGSKDFDVNKINKSIMDAFPEQDKFQAINSKADFLALVKDFPKEAKKAGIKEADLPTTSASAPTMAVMAKGGVVKKPAVKKARTPAQIAATKRMLAALAKYKASKK
jgi:hypothetical protein